MTKEIHDINTRALDFVVELIEYIFEYPDDDYMTMECLCRKLNKYELVDEKDGFYLVAGDALRKTEPTISKMEQVDEPQICDTCRFDDKYGDESICSNCSRHYSDCYEPKDEPQKDMAEDIVRSYGFKAESYQQAKAKDEPQTERSE